MSGNLLITGNSAGLGYGLTEVYLSRSWNVYGLSRRGCRDLAGPLQDIRCDLEDREAIPLALESLLSGIERLELVILNAGILGDMKDLHQASMKEIEQVMEINVWSNKLLLDWLIDSGIVIKQVVAISSGASVSGNRGWNGYGISKAALNMMTALYAAELPNIHFSALAPGIIDTAMQEYISCEVDGEKFPTAGHLKSVRESGDMPDPVSAATAIADAIPQLLMFPSGDYIDIRKMGS